MTVVSIACPLILWAVASGPVDHYKVDIDNGARVLGRSVPHTPPTSSTVLCLPDEQPHIVRVFAVDALGNTGPISGALTIRYDPNAPPGTPTPVVLPTFLPTPTATASPTATPTAAPAACCEDYACQADIDGDGQVEFDDFGLFVEHYLTCNDGRKEKPCP